MRLNRKLLLAGGVLALFAAIGTAVATVPATKTSDGKQTVQSAALMNVARSYSVIDHLHGRMKLADNMTADNTSSMTGASGALAPCTPNCTAPPANCSNGANNPPTCSTCNSGYVMVGGSCVANCTNGANNPPTCNSCPSGEGLYGGSCVAFSSWTAKSGGKLAGGCCNGQTGYDVYSCYGPSSLSGTNAAGYCSYSGCVATGGICQ